MSKKIAVMCAGLMAVGASVVTLADSATMAGSRLTVRASGLESDRGAVAFALFDSRAAFEEGEEPLRKAMLPVREGGCEWTVEGLPPGEYAVKSFHDRNGNGMLDKNGFGAPKEPYGFSNDARAPFGPPAYERAKFTVGAEPATIDIRLK